jgi:hypothetical protein
MRQMGMARAKIAAAGDRATRCYAPGIFAQAENRTGRALSNDDSNGLEHSFPATGPEVTWRLVDFEAGAVG